MGSIQGLPTWVLWRHIKNPLADRGQSVVVVDTKLMQLAKMLAPKLDV